VKANLAINGFGRIGRMVCRRAIQNPHLTLVAINASYDAHTLAHLLRYDTTHGKFEGSIEVEQDALIINGQRVQLVHERDAAKLPWRDLNVDIVVEATGKHKARHLAALHRARGTRKVGLTHAPKHAGVTIRVAANHEA